ncbi:hypothetical protein KY285_005126 [Solanum tuberosum]|nr:hypothetical protein KY284_005350 [Solanum tuberosum]KAH0751978.1 hypothetical protein KY285_005126 [Solanum tuberosum]
MASSSKSLEKSATSISYDASLALVSVQSLPLRKESPTLYRSMVIRVAQQLRKFTLMIYL